MRLHHLGHHAAYTAKANEALAVLRQSEDAAVHDLAKSGIDAVLRNLPRVPEPQQSVLRNHGGGFVNHELFWSVMTPPAVANSSGAALEVELGTALAQAFGSVDAFKRAFEDAAGRVFGSGWVWLELDAESGRLSVTQTANQDTPAMTATRVPLLALDLWEHAYYLQYTNKRAAYVTAWWAVVNWAEVARRFAVGVDAATAVAADWAYAMRHSPPPSPPAADEL